MLTRPWARPQALLVSHKELQEAHDSLARASEAERQSLASALDERTGALETARAEAEELAGRCQRAEADLAAARELAASLDRELALARERHDQVLLRAQHAGALSQQLEEQRAEVERLTARVVALEASEEHLLAEAFQQRHTAARLQSDLARTSAALAQTSDELAAALARLCVERALGAALAEELGTSGSELSASRGEDPRSPFPGQQPGPDLLRFMPVLLPRRTLWGAGDTGNRARVRAGLEARCPSVHGACPGGCPAVPCQAAAVIAAAGRGGRGPQGATGGHGGVPRVREGDGARPAPSAGPGPGRRTRPRPAAQGAAGQDGRGGGTVPGPTRPDPEAAGQAECS